MRHKNTKNPWPTLLGDVAVQFNHCGYI